MKKFVKQCKDFFDIHKKQMIVYLVLIVVLFILVSAYMNLVKLIVFASLIIVLNTFLRFYKRALTGLPFEFELTIFGTLLTGMVFGVWPAIFVAAFSSICADFFNQSIFSPFSFISLFTYIAIAIISPIVPSTNIFISGFTVVIVANLVIFFGNIALSYHDHIKNFIYSASNIFFNYFIFKYLAELVLNILK